MKRFLSFVIGLTLLMTLTPRNSVSAFDTVYAGADNANDYAAFVGQSVSGGGITEKTTAAKNVATSDVSIYKTNGTLYIGYSEPFDGISGEVTSFATGGSYTVSYYNGDSWEDTLISSTTANVANSTDGTFQLTWDRPSDWGKSTVDNYTNESGSTTAESTPYYFAKLSVETPYTATATFAQIGIINYNLELEVRDETGEPMDSHEGVATFSSSIDDTVYVTKDTGESIEYYGFYSPSAGADYTYTYTVPGYVQETGTIELSRAQVNHDLNLDYAHKIIATDSSGTELLISLATAGSNNTTCMRNGGAAYCPVPVDEDGTTATITVPGYAEKTVSIPDRVTDSAAQQVTTVVMGTTTTYAPDLSVVDLYFSGSSLAAKMSNEGNEDVASGTALYMYIYVDGSRKIYELISADHFSAGETGVSTYLPGYFTAGEDYEIEVCLDATNIVADETSESNNCRTETLTYGTSSGSDEPNLTVDDLYFSGERLYAEVSNDGDEDVDSSDSVTLAVYVDGDREYTSSYSYSYFEENESNTFSFTNDNLWDTDESYEIEVCVDYYDVVDESNENDSDNCRTETLKFNSSSEDGPDLDVSSIYLNSDNEVDFKLTNKGDEDVANGETVTIKVYVDDTVEVTTSAKQESDTINFLDEGEESTYTAGDILEDEGDTYEVKVCVDTGDDVDESDEDNNCMTVDEDSIGDESDEDSCGTFVDVDSHWAKDYICNLFNRDVVKGRTDYYFYPNDTVTRAEFLKMVLLSAEMDPYSVSSVQYSDVNSGDWFYSYVTYATAMGYVDGYSDGSFKPNNEINRAEALVILMRVADQTNYDFDADDIDYWDVDVYDWYAYAIVLGSEAGIVSGYSDGSFGPENSILRGESAKIIDLAYDEYFN